jgi:hypothetical protein
MTDERIESLAESFDLLGNRRRLYALLYLRERGGAAALPELAAAVAAREHGSDDVPGEVVDRVTVSLVHVHVPKLRSAGVAEYDPDSERVELTADADSIEGVLDRVFDE